MDYAAFDLFIIFGINQVSKYVVRLNLNLCVEYDKMMKPKGHYCTINPFAD